MTVTTTDTPFRVVTSDREAQEIVLEVAGKTVRLDVESARDFLSDFEDELYAVTSVYDPCEDWKPGEAW